MLNFKGIFSQKVANTWFCCEWPLITSCQFFSTVIIKVTLPVMNGRYRCDKNNNGNIIIAWIYTIRIRNERFTVLNPMFGSDCNSLVAILALKSFLNFD